MHRDLLKQYCRLCGNKAIFAADRKPYNKETYQKTIKEALHLETDNEDSDIFPPFICKTCERKLARFKLLKRQKKVFTVNIPLHDFKGHDDDTCIICTEEAIPNTEDVQRAGKQAAEEQGMSSSRQCDRMLFFLCV